MPGWFKRSPFIWIVALCVLVIVAAVALQLRPKERVAFDVIDYVTGKPVMGATVQVTRVWTRFPVELFGIKPYSAVTIFAPTGSVNIAVRRCDLSFLMWVEANGYGWASIRVPDGCSNPDMYQIMYSYAGPNPDWLHEDAYEYVNLKKRFAVALEPKAGGTGRAGARYLSAPSPGSKERAISTTKYGPHEVRSVKFVNGHWAIRVPNPFHYEAQIDVADDGEILCLHPLP